MTEAKHIPGSWELREEADKYLILDGVVGCKFIIAEIPKGLRDSNTNARLIAAVPVLLAALEEIAFIFCNSDTTNKYAEEMADIAAKAIAKAEGK